MNWSFERFFLMNNASNFDFIVERVCMRYEERYVNFIEAMYCILTLNYTALLDHK